MKGIPRPQSEVAKVREFLKEGLSGYEIARRTGIPGVLSSTGVGEPGRHPGLRRSRIGAIVPGPIHSLEALDREAYSYLLGEYLGDGCV